MTLEEFKAKGYEVVIRRTYTTYNIFSGDELDDNLKNLDKDYAVTDDDYDYMIININNGQKMGRDHEINTHTKASYEVAKIIKEL